MGETPRNILLQRGLSGYSLRKLNIHPDLVNKMFFYVCLL